MHDLSNLLKARKENLSKNFIICLVIGSLIALAGISFGYSTYASLNSLKEKANLTADIKDS